MSIFDVFGRSYQFTSYAVVLLVATLIGLFVAIKTWNRRAIPGARFITWVELAASQWTFTLIFESAALTVELKFVWSVIIYLGTTTVAVFYLMFAIEHSRQKRVMSRNSILALLIVPAFTFLIAATNWSHQLLWTSIVINPQNNLAVYSHGALFWVLTAYSYGAVAVGVILLSRMLPRVNAVLASQTKLMLLLTPLPLLGNLLYILGFDPIPGLDWTPIGFALCGAGIAWAISSGRLFNMLPIARAQVVESMEDGVIVLDLQNRIADINPAACRLLHADKNGLLGSRIADVTAVWPEMDVLGGGVYKLPVASVCGEFAPSYRYIDVNVSPLPEQNNRVAGYLLVMRDITQSRRIEDELSQANQRLQKQLVEIQALQAKLRADAVYDELTGIYNRRHLMETLESAEREAMPYSLVMMDMDRLKNINDTCGHAAGDVMLKHLASVLRQATGNHDTVCRYGGDEFIVVLPATSAAEALRQAEQWRQTVAGLTVACGAGKQHATISLGIVSCNGAARAPDEMLVAADQALYMAKTNGRNCAVVWPGSSVAR